jgi:hypothetical protein
MKGFHENAVLGGGSRSVATLMAATSSIFIRGGKLEEGHAAPVSKYGFGSQIRRLLILIDCRGRAHQGVWRSGPPPAVSSIGARFQFEPLWRET